MTQLVQRTPEQVYDLWIAALESGKYPRGTGKLRNDFRDSSGKLRHSFCCLGVLCDLAQKDGGTEWRPYSPWTFDKGLPTYSYYMGTENDITPEMRSFLGMTAEQMSELMTMNDRRVDDDEEKRPVFSQREIAAYIRDTVKPTALKRLAAKAAKKAKKAAAK